MENKISSAIGVCVVLGALGLLLLVSYARNPKETPAARPDQITSKSEPARSEQSPKTWFAADSTHTVCIDSGGPAPLLDKFSGADKSTVREFRRDDGREIYKVQVTLPGDTAFTELAWTFYTTKNDCEQEQINANKNLADKYR